MIYGFTKVCTFLLQEMVLRRLAGRTSEGICVHLFPSYEMEGLEEFPVLNRLPSFQAVELSSSKLQMVFACVSPASWFVIRMTSCIDQKNRVLIWNVPNLDLASNWLPPHFLPPFDCGSHFSNVAHHGSSTIWTNWTYGFVQESGGRRLSFSSDVGKL